MSNINVPDIFNDNESVLQFRRGLKEASRFLLNGKGLFDQMANDNLRLVVHEIEKKGNGKRNSHMEHLDFEEERSGKQSAICDKVIVTSKMFD